MTEFNLEVQHVIIAEEVTTGSLESANMVHADPATIEISSVGVAGSSGIHIGPTPPEDTTRLWVEL